MLDCLVRYSNTLADWVLARDPDTNPMTRLTSTKSAEEIKVDELDKKLKDKIQQLKRVEEEVKVKKDELEKERGRNDELMRTVGSVEKDRDYAFQRKEYWKRVYHEGAYYKEKLAETERALKAIRKEDKQKTALLERRSSELKAAQAFLSKADSMSEDDVIQVVNDLNAQILQAAASLAEVLRGANYQANVVDTNVFDEIKNMCGLVLAQELQRRDPEVLQVAFQTCIIHVVGEFTTLWDWCTDRSVFDKIYANIHASEEQSVAGRWRALTRTHVQQTQHDPIRGLVIQTTRILTHVLLCTGLPSSYQDIFNYIEKTVGKQVATVVDLAVQLNTCFGIKITSTDLSIFSGPLDTIFDPGMMENYFNKNEKGRENHGRIIGAAEFGLLKTTGTSGRALPGTKVLLKAKVILESALTPVKEETMEEKVQQTDYVRAGDEGTGENGGNRN